MWTPKPDPHQKKVMLSDWFCHQEDAIVLELIKSGYSIAPEVYFFRLTACRLNSAGIGLDSCSGLVWEGSLFSIHECWSRGIFRSYEVLPFMVIAATT